MRIYINGESREVPNELSLADLIAERQLAGQRIAVEINEELVPRSTHASHRLRPDDRVEIVAAIGGG